MFAAARWLTLASAACSLFSIAACQILLAMALAALLLSGARLRMPSCWLPIALFMAGTLISLGLSDDPGDGLSQVRKFYVWLILPLVISSIRDTVWVRRLYLIWGGAAAISAMRALVQFNEKLWEARALGRTFYDFYVVDRITGFMSHWMTFSAQMMYVVIILVAFLFFSPSAHRYRLVWLGMLAVAGAGLVLGFTRGIAFVAAPAAGIYLIWFWKRKAVLAVPLVAAAAFFAAPSSVKARFTSIYQPGSVDSNDFRRVAWTTGLEMIREHPWFGLGPERVKARFEEFVPPGTPRPLPAGWYGHLHNIYLHYAAERGIPTMLVLMWFLGWVVWDFLREIRKLPPGRSDIKFVLHAGVAAVIATLVEGIFELNLGDSEVLTMFLVIVGCGYVARECARAERAKETGASA
ncbi:MAG TPA: O-antigen ligase family protein [Bryobacteraceae bacterium]|nr:O-antigen ligase family protein [Bryobacteraceae bacterium]